MQNEEKVGICVLVCCVCVCVMLESVFLEHISTDSEFSMQAAVLPH